MDEKQSPYEAYILYRETSRERSRCIHTCIHKLYSMTDGNIALEKIKQENSECRIRFGVLKFPQRSGGDDKAISTDTLGEVCSRRWDWEIQYP